MSDFENDYQKIIDAEEGFIDEMDKFVEDNFGELETEEIDDIFRAIIYHNQMYINKRVERFNELNIPLEEYIEEPAQQEVEIAAVLEEPIEPKDISSIVDQFKYCTEDEIDNLLFRIPEQDYNLFKINIYKLIYNLKKEIIQLVASNPIANISSKQKEITKYQYILAMIDELTKKEEAQEIEPTKYNVIFVPNDKHSSFIYEDIASLIENSEELSNIFDKLLTHQFLSTKGIKQLVSYDKLYEYKTKSGFRVLYITMGNNNLAICSIFYKDKQKSSKIANIYEDAQKRYESQEEYLQSNYSSPDFIIEQSELIAQIRTLLSSHQKYTLTKTKGAL